MRVLFVTCELPRITRAGGGNLRQYHLIRGLAENHAVCVVTPVLPWETEYVGELAAICEEVRTVPHPVAPPGPSGSRWRSWQSRLRFAASPRPFEAQRYHRLLGGVAAHVRELAAAKRFDVVQVEHTNVAYWMEHLRTPGFKLLDAHNVLEEWVWRDVRYETRLRRKLLTWLDWAKTVRYERRVLGLFDHCLVVSERDRRHLSARAPGLPFTVVPNGVDTDYFQPAEAPVSGSEILLLGSMNHPPNVDAAVLFCREILPAVLQAVPDARFTIVGRQPTEAVTALANGGAVTVTGEVDDVRPYLARAALVVVPMRQGAGTRIKVLEAMAAGKAVVSTSVGVEGIDVAEGREVLIADSPVEFADRTVRVLRDQALRDGLGAAGRSRVVASYDWRVAVRSVEEVYARARRSS